MREVSDGFLLNMAEVSSALVGLFLVGVFFHVETGFRKPTSGRRVVEAYFYSGTRIVLLLFAFPIGLSLTLVVLEPAWSRVFFALLSLLLVVANFDSARRMWEADKVTHSVGLLVNEVVGTVAVLLLVSLPWALGGFDPSREHLTWAILLAFATGFLSICVLVLSVFDLAEPEAAEPLPKAAPLPENEMADGYSLTVTELARRLGLTVPRTGALIRFSGVQHGADYFSEAKMGSSVYKLYTPKALERLQSLLSNVDIDTIWAQRRTPGPKR